MGRGQDFYKIDEGVGIVQIDNNEQNFTDSRLNSFVLYYKLKVKDSTGKTWETKIISVKIPVIDNLNFYPNVIQSGDQITMNVGELEDVKWELYDMHGRLIKEATQNQPVAAYDISVNTGQYVLKMSQSSISKSNILIIQ